MGRGIKNINNSFTLNVKNNNYDVQPLSLFQLGVSGNSVPIGLGGSGESTTSQNFNMVQNAPSPNNSGFVVGDFFTYTGGTPDGTNIITATAFDFGIQLSNGELLTLASAVAPSENLNSINTKLEQSDAFTPKPSLASLGITLTLVAKIEGGVLTGITFYSTHEGVYIQSVRFDAGASPDFTISFDEAYDNQSNGTATPNNVFVSAPNGNATSQPSYSEINQAQNGSVFDITSMSIQVKDMGVDNQIPQLLQPITFSNVDVDGNEQQKVVVPTIDPNQIQNTLGDIELGDKENGVNYQLDGETALQMNLEGLANVNLTLNYVQLPNLVAGTQFGIEQAMQEQAQMQQEAKDDNFKRKIKLSKASVKALKEDVKKKKFYLLLQNLPSFQTMCGYSLEYSLLPMY